MAIRCLLLSTSRLYSQGFLEYALDDIAAWLGGPGEVAFVPYALADHDTYAQTAAEALAKISIAVRSIHREKNQVAALDNAAAVFVGGGNTFRLLKQLQDRHLLEPIAERVRHGHLAYLGSSAGTNLACPTIRTTNDMPIVEPRSLQALGLVDFQINPHYMDPTPGSTHMGETRQTRLNEFLEENNCTVIGLREGGIIRKDADGTSLDKGSARVFRRGHEPLELVGPADLASHAAPRTLNTGS